MEALRMGIGQHLSNKFRHSQKWYRVGRPPPSLGTCTECHPGKGKGITALLTSSEARPFRFYLGAVLGDKNGFTMSACISRHGANTQLSEVFVGRQCVPSSVLDVGTTA